MICLRVFIGGISGEPLKGGRVVGGGTGGKGAGGGEGGGGKGGGEGGKGGKEPQKTDECDFSDSKGVDVA